MEPELFLQSSNSEEEDEGEKTLEEQGGGGRGSGWGGLCSAALAGGWRLSKKAAVAGAAVTSAPIVIPPLLLISALGLAFSVPFVAFFTSVACTEKLMGSLLPLPPPSPSPPHQDVEKEQEEEDEEINGNGAEFAAEIDPVSSVYSSAAEDHLPDMVDTEGALSTEHGSDTRDGTVTAAPAERKAGMPPDLEGLYSEEKIWEQIIAMRTIVGYEGAPCLTCTEELRALFLITGVELPVSFRDSSDLAEVNVMLQSFKSLVGVK